MSVLVITIAITVKIPDEDTIPLADTDNLVIVLRIEDDSIDWICVANKALEIVWYCLLCLIVPDLYQVVLSSGQQISSV